MKLCLMAHSMSEQHLSVLQVPASLFCVTGASYRDDDWTRTVTTRGRATSQSDTGKRGLMDSNRLWSTPQWIKMTPLSKPVSVIMFFFFSSEQDARKACSDSTLSEVCVNNCYEETHILTNFIISWNLLPKVYDDRKNLSHTKLEVWKEGEMVLKCFV